MMRRVLFALLLALGAIVLPGERPKEFRVGLLHRLGDFRGTVVDHVLSFSAPRQRAWWWW